MDSWDVSPSRGRTSTMSPAFERYIRIDYSGAQTADSSLKGLRVFEAGRTNGATEIRTITVDQKIHWTRRAIAEWLAG